MKNSVYLQRYATPGPYLNEKPDSDLALIVVIPACAEQELSQAVVSLKNCQPPNGKVEVIVVINHSEDADQATRNLNHAAWNTTGELKQNAPDWLKILPLKAYDLPKKHAGVGLARKIGMDEAVRRYEILKEVDPDIHNKGIIVCFDADCTCDTNYLKAVEEHFRGSDVPACSIYYEHPLKGIEYSEKIYEGIIQYELYLRFYVDALRWAGYPYAWQTVGSALAVLSSVYQQQGGMNLRKAGEDFYFLQKLFPLPGFSELNSTRVIPSPRVSKRVPFGTGKVISEWIDQNKDNLPAYSPRGFEDLKELSLFIQVFYQEKDPLFALNKLPLTIRHYLLQRNVLDELARIKSNSSDFSAFKKQFFAWFGGLKVLQFFHYAREYHADIPIVQAAQWLLQKLNVPVASDWEAKELLLKYREMDRKWNYQL